MEYELNYTDSNALPQTGSFIGNGKVGLVNGAGGHIEAERIFISRNLDYKNGQYQPNVVDVFNTYGVEMFALDDMLQTKVTNVSQSLNMDTGIATNGYTVRRANAEDGVLPSALVLENYGNFVITYDENLDLSLPPFILDAESSIYCVRHLPYSTVQTLECTNINKTSIRLLHECWTQENIIDVVYENSVKFTGGDAPLYMFIGHGKTHEGLKIAFASCYLFEGTTVVKPMGTGTNLQTTKHNFQFNCFDLSEIVAGAFKVHIVTTHITANDFDDPRSEAIRIATNICSPNPMATTPTSIAAYIRGRHVDAWTKLWATKVHITPKLDASAPQMAEVRELNTCLYSALYYIYSCVRENFNVDSNPLAIPLLDIDGSLIYEADLWLVPLLLILKPEIARGIVEYRHASLQQAMQLAASYGFEGAKIPYVDDIIGYKNNLYYNTTAYTHVFNTCMVAINAWNYYRVSREKDWLRDKGYNILKSIAIYLVDAVIVDELDGSITLNDIVGLNTRVSLSNNSFTNNLVKLAVKYATEASYELKYPVPDKWLEVFNGLQLPQYPASRIYKVDDQSTMDDKFNVAEVLQTFVPGYWENINRNNSLLFAEIVRNNYDFYTTSRFIPGEETRPINVALRGINAGVVMSTDSSMLIDYMQLLGLFLAENVSGPWKSMKVDVKILNRRPAGLPFANTNSLTSNALFVMMILQGVVQMRIVGGISGTRFYYEDLKVQYITNATMPHYWAYISVSNFGMNNNKGTIDVRQNAYDLQFSPPNIGGAYIMNGNFSAFTP